VEKNGRTLVPVRFVSESFGADVSWYENTQTAEIRLNGTIISLQLGSQIMKVNNREVVLDVPAEEIEGRTLVPLRAVAEALNKRVFWDDKGLIILSDRENIIDSVNEYYLVDRIITYFADPVTFEQKSVSISTGQKTVSVITVNPKDPTVRFEVNIPGGRLNQTENFESQVRAKNALAAINANFFEAYSSVKDPTGHVMIDGKLVFGQSGLTTVGITYEKDIIFSNPGTFVRGGTNGRKENVNNHDGTFDYYQWTAYEVNTRSQSPDTVIMYTPERGSEVDITANGYVAVVRNGVVVSRDFIYAPAKVAIPVDGYLVFIGEATAHEYNTHAALVPGRTADYEYYLFTNTNPNFDWSKMQWAISGGPDLVTDGDIAPPSTHPSFQDERFTTLSTSRTAIGVTENGMLLLVSVPSATINELKEIMKALGAYNAVNLDGGGSTAMYYNGGVITTPGRELVTLLYVYAD